MEDVGDVVSAILIVLLPPKARQCGSASEITVRDAQDILGVRPALRARVIRQQVQAVTKASLKGKLHRVVVSRPIGRDIVTVLRKIRERNVLADGCSRRQNNGGYISLVAVQQVMRVVADVGNRARLAGRQLILYGSIPLLRVGGLPGPLKSDKAQPFRTEIWTCRIGSGRRQPLFGGSLLAAGISKGGGG